MALMLDQFAASVSEMGQYTNLADGLVSGAAFHLPSLGPVGATANATVITISSSFAALLLWVLFSLIGVLLGVVYLGLLARRLPIGGMAHVNLGGFLGRDALALAAHPGLHFADLRLAAHDLHSGGLCAEYRDVQSARPSAVCWPPAHPVG